jgi:V/A-type H+-transporting ATPase subunit E
LGHRELIESLRKEGEESINRLWSEVKAQAEKINADTARRIEELRKKYRKIEETEVKKLEESILFGARKMARIITLSSVKVISDRLFPLAKSSLSELRNGRYREVFSTIVDELPDLVWEEVRVNPLDTTMCRERFPNSRVTPDDTISGGLEVIREDGRICIDNTFEKRLEIAWGDILPLLIKNICKEVSDNESAPAS